MIAGDVWLFFVFLSMCTLHNCTTKLTSHYHWLSHWLITSDNLSCLLDSFVINPFGTCGVSDGYIYIYIYIYMYIYIYIPNFLISEKYLMLENNFAIKKSDFKYLFKHNFSTSEIIFLYRKIISDIQKLNFWLYPKLIILNIGKWQIFFNISKWYWKIISDIGKWDFDTLKLIL